MTKVKVFEKVKLQGQSIKWKVLPEGIHMWNIKTLTPTNQKSWQGMVLEKKVKLQGQNQRVKVTAFRWKVLPEEIHMWNMKALASTNQKL
jgi:hypothetical protein